MTGPAIRVLYVDDEPGLLEIGKVFLEQSGDFTVTTALSATSAIRLLENEKFDAIVSDYQMPGMDGIQFLIEVRTRFGPIPFILFTGKGREDVVIQAINSGVDFYLQKGGDPEAQFAELSHKVRMAASRTRAEEALSTSEARFRALFENASDIIRILDRDGRVVFDTAVSGHLLGYPPGFTIGRDPLEFIHPDDVDMVKRELSEVYTSTNTGVPTEFRLRKADGSYTWVESTGKNLIGVHGIDGIVITTRFIDERKKAEGALQESKRELADIIEFLPDATFVIDRQGVVIAWNRAMEEMTGTSKDEMIGQGDHAYTVPFYGERRHQLLDLIDLDNEELQSKYQYVTRKGNTLYAEVFTPALYGGKGAYVWATGSPLFNSYGERIGAIESIRDITEWEHADVALHESEKKYRDIFEHSVTGLFKTAPGGQLIDANDALARMYGYSGAPEILQAGIRVGQLYASQEDREEVLHILSEKGMVENYEAPHRKRDGNHFWVSITARTIRDADGAVLFYEGTNIDITGRKRAEEELLRKSEELEAANEELTATGEELKAQYDALMESERSLRETEGRVRLKLESLLAPGGNIDTLDLGDIIDPQVLQPLMDNFTRVTGMATAVLDTKGKVLVATGWQEICTRFHRVNPVTAGFCTESDLHLAKNLKQGEYVAYQCQNNLWDVVTPLYVGNRHMGNIFTGQFFYDDEVAPESVFIAQAEQYGFNRDEYLAAFRRVPRFSREKVNELMDYLVKFTGFISRLSISNLELARMGTERDTLLNSLQKSEERYRTLVENIPQKIFIKDLHSRYVTINENFARDLGIKPGDIVGKSDADLFPAELAAVYYANDLRVLETGQTEEFEEQYLLGGKETWVRTIKTAVRDKEGKIVGLLGVFWDITERKLVGEELRKSEERFRNVIAATDAYIFEVDAYGIITFLSDRVKDILGYEPQELVGKTPFDTMTTPEEVTRVRAIFEEYLRSRLPIRRMEHNCRSKDGRELMLTVTAMPMLDAAGEIKGYQGTVEDITERKLAEEHLRQQTDAMEAAIDGLAILDNNQNYTYVNRAHAAIYGYEHSGELIGRSWRILYDPVELQRFEQEIMPELGRKGHYQGRATGKKKDGSQFPQEVSLTILEDGGLICVVRDITERKLAEERLKESEERYLSLFDRSLDCIYIHDLEGNFIDANPAALELMGYTKEGISDVSFTSLISGEQLNKARETIRTIIETGSHPDVMEYRLQAKNGNFVDIETKGSLILHNKKPYAIMGIARDITERKRIDEELMESEEKFRATIGQSRDGILITDEDFHIIEWNTTQTTIYGYTRDEMLGRPLWEFQFASLPEEKRSPVLLEKMKQSMLNIRKSSDSAWMNSLHDFEVQNKNGQCRTVQISTFPIVFRDRIFFGSISRDITDKKQAEKELRESEEQLHNFISNLPVGLYRNTTGPLGKCLMANPFIARMHGYDTLEEFLRKPTADMYANPEERVAFSDQLINKGSIFGREIHLKRKNNELFWGRVSAVAVRDQQGDVQYFDGFIEDISDKKRAEEALQLATKKLSLLSSITRHDINNQLTVLRGYLAILEKNKPDPTLNENLGKVSNAANRIASMILFTKEYERIGVNAPAWQECCTIVETVAKEAPLGNVTVKNDLPAGAEVFADPLILKVFFNLMDNAARYGGKITTLRFSVEERDTDYILVCEDDGEGIPADEKEKIFERGFGKNTGMGLFLSREILSITGITIGETGEPGKGARFEMTVPKGAWRVSPGSDQRYAGDEQTR